MLVHPIDCINLIGDASFLIPRNAPEYILGFGFQYTLRKLDKENYKFFPNIMKSEILTSDLLNSVIYLLGCVANTNTEDASTTISYY